MRPNRAVNRTPAGGEGYGERLVGARLPYSAGVAIAAEKPRKGACDGFTCQAYLIVADADAVYGRAKAGGAMIVRDIKDEDYGGRGFTCRDLEGHIWSIGTYDPW